MSPAISDNNSVSSALLKKRKWKPTQLMCTGLVLIPLLAYVFFNAFPIVLSFVAQFMDIRGNRLDAMAWNNFDNFKHVFEDSKFWKSWGITLWLTCAQFVSLAIALLIAVLLEQKIKGAKIFQILFFIPYICSTVAIAIMWAWIFDKNGILNAFLGRSVELGNAIDWLNNLDKPSTLTWCVFITIIWSAPGYGIVMYKAALKSVNPALYEAASMDGANAWHKFWHITFPSIKSVTLFLLLAGIGAGLSTFDAVTVLAPINWTGHAGPEDMGLTISYYIYNNVHVYSDPKKGMGIQYAAVMSWILFLVTFAASFFLVRARNKAEEE